MEVNHSEGAEALVAADGLTKKYVDIYLDMLGNAVDDPGQMLRNAIKQDGDLTDEIKDRVYEKVLQMLASKDIYLGDEGEM